MKLNSAIYLFILEFALIPLVFVGFIIYSYNKVQNTKITLEKIDAIAQIQSNRLKDVLNQKLDLLALFTTKPLLRKYLHDYNSHPSLTLQKNMNDNLLEAKGGSKSIKDIIVTNPNGQVVASTDPLLINRNISSEDYYQRGMKQDDASVLKRDASNVVVQLLAGPLILDNETLGTVVLITGSEDITGLANDYTGLGQSGETLLVRDDGQGNALFLTDTKFDQSSGLTRVVPKTERNVPAIHVIAGEEKIFDDLVDYRRIPVFAATRYLKDIGWGVVVKIDKAEATAPIKNYFRYF